MADMNTVLKHYSSNGESQTFALPNHTYGTPEVVVQKRTTPRGSSTATGMSFIFSKGTTMADGSVHPTKVNFTFSYRFPTDGQTADVNALLAYIRDMVAGDNLTRIVASQLFLDEA
jgi:hypothetical protein